MSKGLSHRNGKSQYSVERNLSPPKERLMASISRAPVERALHILETMNGAPVMPIREIATATGLPKSSVVRVLGQLAADGYRLTSRVRRLS